MMFDVTAFSISGFWPTHGPVAGGTEVTVHLDGRPDGLHLFCRFGSAELHQLVAAAQTATSSALQCKSPSHPAGATTLTIISLEDDAAAPVEFVYDLEPVVRSATPNRALEAALTPIYVHGEHFVNSSSLSCAFGSARANATFITNTTIVCVAPIWNGLVHDEMRVPLRVSTNAQDFSSTQVAFEFVACPPGAYCSHLQVLPCPWGAACNSRGGSNFTECVPGTYQSRTGRSSCTPCPIGHYCPAPGLPEPLICPAGFVCSMEGLSYPNTPCPSGHFCPPGVESMDPITQRTERRPLECPENTWCPAGVADNVTMPGNMSTPQPCLAGFVCFRGSDSAMGSGPCPTGYYCPPNSLPIECSPGHYCSGVGNVFPAQCTPGYYNDKYGRNQCIECPIGFICPQVGLQVPVPCPAGAVCNEPGLKAPSMDCPPGYFCWEGTETADWNAETVYKPIACPDAVYCLGGITNNMTNEEDYRSPQPCPLGQYCKEASTHPLVRAAARRASSVPRVPQIPSPRPPATLHALRATLRPCHA